MRIFLVALALAASVATARAQTPAPAGAKTPTKPAAAKGPAHVLLTPDDVKWGPAPPSVPPGAFVAVLDGDPTKAGPFTIRLKLPDGYKVAPHWHPTDEHLTVIQGTFRAGMGDAATEAGYKDFPPGSFITMPKQMHHFASAKGEMIVQVQSEGPFVVNYVNAADVPKPAPSR
jgi:quercetin dioxygenase-like cupin family protein